MVNSPARIGVYAPFWLRTRPRTSGWVRTASQIADNRIATVLESLFAYAFVRLESEQNGSHLDNSHYFNSIALRSIIARYKPVSVTKETLRLRDPFAIQGTIMFGFPRRRGRRHDLSRKRGYMQDAQQRWRFLTNFDLSTIKHDVQLSSMVKDRSGIQRHRPRATFGPGCEASSSDVCRRL